MQYSIKPLLPTHAREISRLEKRNYADNPALCLGYEDYYSDLHDAEEEKGNLSLGIFLSHFKKTLLGYIVAFEDESEVDQYTCAYVSDLVLDKDVRQIPEVRAHFRELLTTFVQTCREKALPIEAHLRLHTSYPMITKEGSMESLRLRCSHKTYIPNYHGGESVYFMRFTHHYGNCLYVLSLQRDKLTSLNKFYRGLL